MTHQKRVKPDRTRTSKFTKSFWFGGTPIPKGLRIAGLWYYFIIRQNDSSKKEFLTWSNPDRPTWDRKCESSAKPETGAGSTRGPPGLNFPSLDSWGMKAFPLVFRPWKSIHYALLKNLNTILSKIKITFRQLRNKNSNEKITFLVISQKVLHPFN
jgi:hypothetical protein